MQFLPSLHIVLTCSFVVLLAYVLSRFFTFLAHSAIHGSGRARTTAETSSRGRGIGQSSVRLTEQSIPSAAPMYRLQEEDEDEVETDVDGDRAEPIMAPQSLSVKYEMAGGIFDDAIDQQYSLTPNEAAWDNGEGLEDATDNYGRYSAEERRDTAQRVQGKDSEEGHMKRRGAARENGLSSTADDAKEGEEERDNGSKSVLADAEGSSSLQRRLPPTWSDLEIMVSSNSMKHSVPVPEG